mgnify:FL=1
MAKRKKKYCPSNGSEGEWFINKWCCNCKRDQKFLAGKSEKGCQILSDTFSYNVGDPGYPNQWIYDKDGQPCCTAFESTLADSPKEEK